MEHILNCKRNQEIRNLNQDEYGERYSDHLLEQYKLYVEMADRVSQRRDQSNRFYAGLLTALIALLVVLTRFDVSDDTQAVIFLIDGLFGVALSIVWYFNIRSYRTLNGAKFQIINELEQRLPAQGYSKEWDILRPPDDRPKYLQLTRVEQVVPLIFSLVFGVLAVYSIVFLCT